MAEPFITPPSNRIPRPRPCTRSARLFSDSRDYGEPACCADPAGAGAADVAGAAPSRMSGRRRSATALSATTRARSLRGAGELGQRHQALDHARAVVGDDEDLAVAPLSERDDEERRLVDLLRYRRRRGRVEAEEAALLEVAVDVHPLQLRQARAVVDEAADDRLALRVVVHRDGRDEAGRIRRDARRVGEVPLLEVPAVVAALHDLVDLLGVRLADVAGPELPGRGVEAHLPGVAQAVGPDL